MKTARRLDRRGCEKDMQGVKQLFRVPNLTRRFCIIEGKECTIIIDQDSGTRDTE